MKLKRHLVQSPGGAYRSSSEWSVYPSYLKSVFSPCQQCDASRHKSWAGLIILHHFTVPSYHVSSYACFYCTVSAHWNLSSSLSYFSHLIKQYLRTFTIILRCHSFSSALVIDSSLVASRPGNILMERTGLTYNIYHAASVTQLSILSPIYRQLFPILTMGARHGTQQRFLDSSIFS